MKNIDKYKGCLLGGAAGDALGYAVEFLDYGVILEKYGENGITEYRLSDGKALISDDTQMTLFTANALSQKSEENNYILNLYENYIDWFATQFPSKSRSSWLLNIEELCQLRAPGNTCLAALSSGEIGSVSNPINDSKGCGGIMRVAPVALFSNDSMTIDEIDMLGAEAAAITHGHELGYIPAAMFVHIIYLVVHDDKITLLKSVNDAVLAMKKLFSNAKHLTELLLLIDKAIELSNLDINDQQAISQLGEGWVAEETLAIAIYCALKYEHDFDKAVIAAVNHSGDSDSTGSVCGNILGAYLGVDAIPDKYLDNLELKEVIEKVAINLLT